MGWVFLVLDGYCGYIGCLLRGRDVLRAISGVDSVLNLS